MQLEDGRLVALNGTRNLRDLGGYPTRDGRRTRWRTLYRSDCLDQLDQLGQEHLVGAGVRTIIDLRDDREVAVRPNVFADSARIRYRHMPMWNEPLPADVEPDLIEGYLRELDLRGDRLRAVLEVLLEPGALPALIHCAAGKDRTGVVVGLLLEAVGVSREAIAQDYALSGRCLGPEYIAESRRLIVAQGLDWQRWEHLFETPAERMHKTLDYLDRQFGGIEAYFVGHGLERSRLALLVELITEPTREP